MKWYELSREQKDVVFDTVANRLMSLAIIIGTGTIIYVSSQMLKDYWIKDIKPMPYANFGKSITSFVNLDEPCERIYIPTAEKLKANEETKDTGSIKKEMPTFEYQWKGKCITPEFLEKVLAICIYFEEKYQKVIKPDSLMAIFACESGFNPAAYNADPEQESVGLIQFMPEVAKSLGTTVEELKQMSALEQLDYVKKYYENIIIEIPDALLETTGDLYAVTFMRRAATYSQEQPMGVKNVKGYYSELDEDRNDIINKKDFELRVMRLASGYIEAAKVSHTSGGGILK